MPRRDELRVERAGSTARKASVANGASVYRLQQPVELRHRPAGIRLVERQRPHPVPELRHRRRRLHALADDVADGEPEPAVGQHQRVEPVAADVHRGRAGQVARGDAHALDIGDRLGQDAPLERLGDRPLPLVAARAVERQAALRRQGLEEAPRVVVELGQARATRVRRRRGAVCRPGRGGTRTSRGRSPRARRSAPGSARRAGSRSRSTRRRLRARRRRRASDGSSSRRAAAGRRPRGSRATRAGGPRARRRRSRRA